MKTITLERLPQPTSYIYQIEHALVSGELQVSLDSISDSEAMFSSLGIIQLPRMFGATIEYRGYSRWQLNTTDKTPVHFAETRETISRGEFKRRIRRTPAGSYDVVTSTAKMGEKADSLTAFREGVFALEAQGLFFLGPTLARMKERGEIGVEDLAIDVLVGTRLYHVIIETSLLPGTSNLTMRMKQVLPENTPLVRDLSLVVNLGSGAIDEVEVRVKPPFGTLRFKLQR